MNISFLGQLKLNYISPYDPKPHGNGRFPGYTRPYGRDLNGRPLNRNMYPFDHFFRNRRYPFDDRYIDRFDRRRRILPDRYGYNRHLPPPVKGQL